MNKLKTILFILAFCLSCSLSHAQYVSKLRLTHNITDTVKSTQTLSEKSPFLAGTLSFIVPGFGLGQLYNGQTNKCLIHSQFHIPCDYLAVVIYLKTDRYVGPEAQDNGPDCLICLFLVFTTTGYGASLMLLHQLNKINKQIKLQKYRSDIMNRIKLGFNVDKNKQLNLKFAFEL